MKSMQKTESKIDDNTLTHTEPHETAQDAEKISLLKHGSIDNDVNESLNTRLIGARQKMKELRESGNHKSTAERFIDNPRIHRAVRRFCWECNGFSPYHASNCENTNCALWLFRHGKTIVRDEELPVWQDAHKRWLQKVGEWKPGTSEGNESDENDSEN